MTTQVLTTAVAAQEGGDVPICRPIHGTPTPVNDVSQCPGGADPDHPEHCRPHCIVDISGMPVGERAPEQTLKDALLRCNTTVRLGPDIKLDYSKTYQALRPLQFNRCVTLTSVNDFKSPTSEARTPRSLGPELHYGEPESWKSFLSVGCNDNEVAPWGDDVRISGFRIFGTTDEQQKEDAVGIRVRRCVNVEISNMEIHGFGEKAIQVENLPTEQPARIIDFSQVRIHDNFIHHNQHPAAHWWGAMPTATELKPGTSAHVRTFTETFLISTDMQLQPLATPVVTLQRKTSS